MNVLFLDLASHNGLLACVTESAVVASDPVDHRISDDQLMPLLEGILKTAGWSFADLTHIACVVGPGGFMSLRVAVALANTLVHQLKIPGTGVHLSDVYAARIPPHPPLDSARGTLSRGTGEGGVRDFLWLHSTKKQALFVRGFGKYAKQWPEAEHVMLEEFGRAMPQGARWVGELIPAHAALVAHHGLAEAVLLPLADVLPAFLARCAYSNKTLEPWYGREG